MQRASGWGEAGLWCCLRLSCSPSAALVRLLTTSAYAAGVGCAVLLLAMALFASDRVLLAWSEKMNAKAYAGSSVDGLSKAVEKLDILSNVRNLAIILGDTECSAIRCA